MDETIALPAPKIDLVEFLYIGVTLAIVSLINLIPLAGDITSLVAGGLMFFYLFQKGLMGTSTVATNVIGYACGFIPFLQWIPTELAAWVITFIIDRNPKLEAAAEKVGAVENLAEGGGETSGAAGEAGGAAAATGETAEGAAGATGETAGTAGAGTGAETPGAQSEGSSKNAERQRERREEGEEMENPAGGGDKGEGGGERGTEGPSMESGAEIPPEAEMKEELFDPEEARFREAPEVPAAKDEAERAGEPPSRETEAERKAREDAERRKRNEERMERFKPQDEEGGADLPKAA